MANILYGDIIKRADLPDVFSRVYKGEEIHMDTGGGSYFYINCDKVINSPQITLTSKPEGLEYSLDQHNWTLVDSVIDVELDKPVYFRGGNPYNGNLKFSMTGGDFSVGGKLTKSFGGYVAPGYSMGKYVGLFKDNTRLVNAEDLDLGYIKGACMSTFYEMFAGCSRLKKAPKYLRGEGIFQSTFDSMFKDCSSLEVSPIIDVHRNPNQPYYRSIGNDKYTFVYNGTERTIIDSYSTFTRMFMGCSKLKEILTPISGTGGIGDSDDGRRAYYLGYEGCGSFTYYHMCEGCGLTSLHSTSKDSSGHTVNWYADNFMVVSETKIDSYVCELSTNCFAYMFKDCVNLKVGETPGYSIKNIDVPRMSGLYYHLFEGCTGITGTNNDSGTPVLGTGFVHSCELPNNGVGGMYFGCTSLRNVQFSATSLGASGSTGSWLPSDLGGGSGRVHGHTSYSSTQLMLPSNWHYYN